MLSRGPHRRLTALRRSDGHRPLLEQSAAEEIRADFVIGSRLRGTREQGSLLPSQVFAGWMVGKLLRVTLGARYTDMGPFRAIRRTSLEQLQMSEMTYGWNLEMQIKACRHGLRIAEMAARSGITISLEYHADTLTDARDSARTLMDEISHPNFIFLWQTANGEDVEQNIARLHDVTPRMGNIHVFHWWPTGADRKPLVEGEDRWKQYLDIIRATGKSRSFLLEFVRGDSQDQFLEDAATLRRWLQA